MGETTNTAEAKLLQMEEKPNRYEFDLTSFYNSESPRTPLRLESYTSNFTGTMNGDVAEIYEYHVLGTKENLSLARKSKVPSFSTLPSLTDFSVPRTSMEANAPDPYGCLIPR